MLTPDSLLAPELLDVLDRRDPRGGELARFEEHAAADPDAARWLAAVEERMERSARLTRATFESPNAADVAGWLRCPPDGLRVYGEEMRPVPLQVRVQSFPEDKRGDFMFERSLARHVVGVLEGQYRVGGRWQWKPTLVFCSSRKGCSDTAR